MWVKYSYLCTNCDSLIEITTQHENFFEPECPCYIDKTKLSSIVRINMEDVTKNTPDELYTQLPLDYN